MSGRFAEGQLKFGSRMEEVTPRRTIRIGVILRSGGRDGDREGVRNNQFIMVPPTMAAEDRRIIGSGESIVSSLREEEGGVNFGAHSVAKSRRTEYIEVRAVASRSKIIIITFLVANTDVSIIISLE